MSCECSRCRQHYKVLGFVFGVPEESEIHEAYRESIKQWHPDLYENYASLRAEAEARFKEIQVAYRELKEHNATPDDEPLDLSPARPSYQPPDQPFAQAPAQSSDWDIAQPHENNAFVAEAAPSGAPLLSFDGAPGCLVESQFTPEIHATIARNLGTADTPLAIIDIASSRSGSGYSQFLLLAARGIMVRDARNNVSLLWYKDLGEINVIDRRRAGKPGFSHKLFEKVAGGQPNYSLQIQRSNGTPFFSLSDPVDENVIQVVYEFLLQQRAQAQR